MRDRLGKSGPTIFGSVDQHGAANVDHAALIALRLLAGLKRVLGALRERLMR